LETKNIGKIYINKSDIKSIKEIKATTITLDKDGSVETYAEYRDVGPFTTRAYFTANAIPMEKGENYALIHLYGPEVHFGVKENLSLGVMSSWIASPIAVAAKYTFYNKDNTSLAFGNIVGSSGYLMNAQGFFGLHWLTATSGTPGKNMSVSAGVSYANLGNDWFDTDIGAKHDYYYSNDYPLPSYNAYQAVTEKLYGGSYTYNDFYFDRGTAVSAVLGLSGITPVGKKASFIFDAMGFVNQAKTVEYKDRDITVTYTDNSSNQVTSTFTIGEGSVVNNGLNVNVVLMPGMRFHQTRNKAFQVALAGVISSTPDRFLTFPVPMVSWLRQF
jgi:hypothetical protein